MVTLETIVRAGMVVNLDALGAIVCCLGLLGWWAFRQCRSRCAECGYCPIWCQCEHDDHRDERHPHRR